MRKGERKKEELAYRRKKKGRGRKENREGKRKKKGSKND